MLLNAKKLEGYSLRAADGEIGKIKDVYFDDRRWGARYVVVNTGNWLVGRKVLISPTCFGSPEFEQEVVPVSLTCEQIEASPSIETDKPITQEYEEALHTYYDWPQYWVGPGFNVGLYGGGLGVSTPVPPSSGLDQPETAEEKTADLSPAERHLQSVKEVRGWSIQASDGEIGHVEDVLISPSDDWSIRQIVIDTRNWLPGRTVLVAPAWIAQFDWRDKQIQLDLDRETIKAAPEYDPGKQIDATFESELQAHYQSAPSPR